MKLEAPSPGHAPWALNIDISTLTIARLELMPGTDVGGVISRVCESPVDFKGPICTSYVLPKPPTYYRLPLEAAAAMSAVEPRDADRTSVARVACQRVHAAPARRLVRARAAGAGAHH